MFAGLKLLISNIAQNERKYVNRAKEENERLVLRNVRGILAESVRNYIRQKLLAICSVFGLHFLILRSFKTTKTEINFGIELDLFTTDQIESRKLQEIHLAAMKANCLVYSIRYKCSK